MKRIVTAVFDTRAEAERARMGLRALGVPHGDIALHGAHDHDEPPASDAAPGSEPWLPGLLDLLFRREADFAVQMKAMERGGVAVTARVAPELAAAAARALEQVGGRYSLNATEPVRPTS